LRQTQADGKITGDEIVRDRFGGDFWDEKTVARSEFN
jgi:hypothetical protein